MRSRWHEVPKEVILKCWAHCNIVDGVTLSQVAQGTDYGKPVDTEIESELAILMEAKCCEFDAREYVEADSTEPIECLNDIIERGTDDADANSSDSETETIECCLTIASLLAQRQDSSD